MKVNPELPIRGSGARLENERESESIEGETVFADGEEEIEGFVEEMVVDEAVDESIVEDIVGELGMREEEERVTVFAEEESSLEEGFNEENVMVEIVADERCVEKLQMVDGGCDGD